MSEYLGNLWYSQAKKALKDNKKTQNTLNTLNRTHTRTYMSANSIWYAILILNSTLYSGPILNGTQDASGEGGTGLGMGGWLGYKWLVHYEAWLIEVWQTNQHYVGHVETIPLNLWLETNAELLPQASLSSAAKASGSPLFLSLSCKALWTGPKSWITGVIPFRIPGLSIELVLCKVAVDRALWLLTESNSSKWYYGFCLSTELIRLSVSAVDSHFAWMVIGRLRRQHVCRQANWYYPLCESVCLFICDEMFKMLEIWAMPEKTCFCHMQTTKTQISLP